MITSDQIPEGPEEYEPFEKLEICSNTLIGGGIPLVVDDVVPLLVGRGDVPRIWLSAPDHPTNREWKDLVTNNTVDNEAYLLVIDESNDEVRVTLSETPILRVRKHSDQHAAITQLDLRPLGLDIHGTEAGLHVTGNLISTSTFEGVTVMVNLSTGRQAT